MLVLSICSVVFLYLFLMESLRRVVDGNVRFLKSPFVFMPTRLRNCGVGASLKKERTQIFMF